MKKFLLTLLALVWVSAAAFAGEYTIQFKGTGTTSDSSQSYSESTSVAGWTFCMVRSVIIG